MSADRNGELFLGGIPASSGLFCIFKYQQEAPRAFSSFIPYEKITSAWGPHRKNQIGSASRRSNLTGLDFPAALRTNTFTSSPDFIPLYCAVKFRAIELTRISFRFGLIRLASVTLSDYRDTSTTKCRAPRSRRNIVDSAGSDETIRYLH